jgi:ribosomal protein S18 acetylase RimI-like enzyme
MKRKSKLEYTIRTCDPSEGSISSEELNQMIDILNENIIEQHKWKQLDGDYSSTYLASKDSITANNFIKYAKDKNNKILGFVLYDVQKDFNKTIVYICKINVAKQYRCNNIGSELIRELFIEHDGAQFEACHVYERNIIGQKFWNSLGFCTKLYTTLLASYPEG